jgi:tetratricopeptide (TPR) repeat protein
MKLQQAANTDALNGEEAVAARAIFFLRDDTGAAAASMDKRLVRLRDEITQLGRTGHLRHVVRYAGDGGGDTKDNDGSDQDDDEEEQPKSRAGGARAALSKSMLMGSDDEGDGDGNAIDLDANATTDDAMSASGGLALLGRECAERLQAILAADFPLRSVPSALEAEATAQRALVARLSRGFVARLSLLRSIDAVASGEAAESVLFVTGGDGVGKSTLLANWWRRWRATHGAADGSSGDVDRPLRARALGAASATSSQLPATLLRLTRELERAFGLADRNAAREVDGNADDGSAAADDADDEFDNNDGDDLPHSDAFARSIGSGSGDDGGTGSAMRVERLAAQFGERLRAAAARAGAGIVLVIDGVELLAADDAAAASGDEVDPLHWLPQPLPDGVRVLIGARHVPTRWRGISRLLSVPLLTPAQSALICARRLAEFGKSLSSVQLDALAHCAAMRTPRFARIVADELRALGDFDHLDARLARYLSHSDTAALRQFVLSRLAREFAQPPGYDGLLANVFACLLSVPQGLREAELLAASRCPPVTWAVLSTALQGGEVLVRRGELLAFADAGVTSVASAMCDARTLKDAQSRLERHYERVAARELRTYLNDPAAVRESERRVRRGLPPPVPTSALLVRSLRQRLALLNDTEQVGALGDVLLQPSTFDVLWHARGADAHAARFDLFRFWRAARDAPVPLGDTFVAQLAAECKSACDDVRRIDSRLQQSHRRTTGQQVSADGFVLGAFDVAEQSAAGELSELAVARGRVMELFRRASAFARFSREAVSAACAQQAAATALQAANTLRVGRRGEGRAVTAMAALAYAMRLSGQLHDAAALYRQALESAERLVGSDRDMRLAQLINALAICLRQLAQYKEAEQYYSRALEIRVAHFGELSVDVAQSHNSIGCLHQDLGNYDLSEYHLVRAIELRERLLGAQHPDVAMSLCNLGGLKLAMGKMDEAERLYRRAMAIYMAAYGEQHSGTAQCLNSLAGLAAERRRDVEARRLYTQVLAIRRAVLGAEHPDVAVTLNDMAVMLVREGEHQAAEPMYREALRIRRTVLGPNHIDTGASLQNLGLLLADVERYAEAEESMQDSLRITQLVLGASHVDIAGCYRSLAGLAQKQNQFERAIGFYTQALSIFRERVGELHVDFALTCNDMAVLYMRMVNPSAAAPLYEDALRAYTAHFGKEHADVALATLNLAECVATQALQRGAAGGALALLHRCAGLYREARERFVNVREGAVSGAGAQNVTREQRLMHIDRTLERVAAKIVEVESKTK